MRVVLHCGTYKTGTTSIQRFLMRRRGELIDAGFYVPIPEAKRHPNQHAHLATWTLQKSHDKTKTYFDKAKHEASKLNCHTILISSEALSSLNQVQAGDLCHSIGEETTCLLYFRNIYTYALSTLSQLLKSPDIKLFGSEKLHRTMKNRLSYDTIVENWSQSCSMLIVRSYDSCYGGLLSDYLAAVGAPVEIKRTDEHYINKSLRLTPMIFLVLQGHVRSHRDYVRIAEVFAKKTPSSFKVTPQEIMLSRLIIDMLGSSVEHNALREIRDYLTAIPEASHHDNIKQWGSLLSIVKGS